MILIRQRRRRRREAIRLPVEMRQLPLQDPEDALQHPTIIDTGYTSGLVRQQRLDHVPLKIGQTVSAHADPESEKTDPGNPVYGFMT